MNVWFVMLLWFSNNNAIPPHQPLVVLDGAMTTVVGFVSESSCERELQRIRDASRHRIDGLCVNRKP